MVKSRPRERRVDHGVLQAIRDAQLEVGYAGLTVEVLFFVAPSARAWFPGAARPGEAP
ncbi:hypothetical protein [Sorangium sp. So ce1099]|uniref:hypothetical protein n=1 Tax=Sorangium sp. So ce1099 TaxID=3133331 RepID=UPI003F609583